MNKESVFNCLFCWVFFFVPLLLKKKKLCTLFANTKSLHYNSYCMSPSPIFSKRNNLYVSSLWLTTQIKENEKKRNKTMNWWKLLIQCVTLTHAKCARLCNTRVHLLFFPVIMTKIRHQKTTLGSIIVLFSQYFLAFAKTQFLHEAVILEIIWTESYLFQTLL